MKLTIEQLSRLFEKYGDGIEIKYFDDILIKEQCYLSTDLVLPAHLPRLTENGIAEVEVFFTLALHEYLAREFPVEFRKPFNRCTMSDMDRMLEGLRDANTQSKRKRYIRMIGEIYGVDKTLGRRIILLRYNEPVDFKKWNNLKRDVDRNQNFYYRNSEVSIIIFVDLKVARQKEYIERFKINTDLISLIVTRSQEPTHVIAPDFITPKWRNVW